MHGNYKEGWFMQDVRITTKGTLRGGSLAAWLSERSGAGPAWHSVTRIGLLGCSLLLAACSGESSDAATDAGEDSSGSANGGNGGSGGNPEASGSDGASTASALAYSECGSGGGGCPASDPICLDEDGVVAAVTGGGGPTTTVLFEACSRACETDSDCPAGADTEARPRCVPDGGTNVCALDCSDGAECPQGMACSYNGQLCMYLHFAEWNGNCADPSASVSCEGDCLGQNDVTCTKICSETEFTCVANDE